MGFEGKRLVLVAQEAGAGSLLAALSAQWRPAPSSTVIASAVAAPYFAGCGMDIVPDGISDTDIADLLERLRPEGVVVGCGAGATVEKRVLQVAQAVGIPVDAFVDHYWNLWQRFAAPLDARPWAVVPDRIHVPAPACVEPLVDAGYPRQQVSAFVHPLMHPGGLRRDAVLRKVQRERLGIAADETVAVFVSEPLFPTDTNWDWDQAHEADYRDLLTSLLQMSADGSRSNPLVVLVRCHPAEPDDRWSTVCASVPGGRWHNASGIAKDALFSVADIVLGVNSMLMLEAVAAGLPTFSRHTIKTRQKTWLSTIRPEIVELADDQVAEQAIRSVSQVGEGE
jgi:hypothetical protein